MLRRTLIGLTLCSALWAQEVAPPGSLTKEEIATAVADEKISLPVPGELFAALSKQGRIDWSAQLRKAPSGTFTNRQQIALNLGTLVADGYLAVEAQDKQQVKNISNDIRVLAKALGVQESIVARGRSIIQFAEDGQWETLREELEATQNEVIAAMVAHKDPEFVTLVMLGGWLRGTEVVSSYITAHYSEAGAKVLRQPAVVDHFVQKLAGMPKKVVDNPLVDAVRLKLFEIKKAVTFGSQVTPTEDDVKKLSELAASVVKSISTKE